MNKEGNDGRILKEGSEKMVELMFDFFKENRQFQPYTFGIIGHATELLMHFLCYCNGENYDQISEDYRDFLCDVHGNIKAGYIKAVKTEDLKAN